ncbi:unnamed protein product [Lathyrus sativus]|nr:unnamed protein product [Lathyrus sativus]
MADREDRLRLGRLSQHASVRCEQSQTSVTEVDTAETQSSTSHAQDIPSTLYPTPSSTSSSWRHRDSTVGSSQASSSDRPRRDTPVPPSADDPVPPLEGDNPPLEDAGDDDDDEPEDFPRGPSDMSLLTGYADHTARHVWDGETRQPQKFYNHGGKISSLEHP